MARESKEAAGRKARVPLGVPRAKLSAPSRDGYVRRWVVDHPGRLQAAEEGGYQFVEDSGNRDAMASRISRIVGKNEDGRPQTAYLMEIQKEWYDEDQKAKGRQDDKTEEALRKGSDKHGEPGKEGRYIPREGITIESKYQP